MTIEELNAQLKKYADGRVSVKFDPTFEGGTYYTYDSFSGPGRKVQESFEDALSRVERLDEGSLSYATHVENALSGIIYV